MSISLFVEKQGMKADCCCLENVSVTEKQSVKAECVVTTGTHLVNMQLGCSSGGFYGTVLPTENASDPSVFAPINVGVVSVAFRGARRIMDIQRYLRYRFLPCATNRVPSGYIKTPKWHSSWWQAWKLTW
jgi:hypothetical protein